MRATGAGGWHEVCFTSSRRTPSRAGSPARPTYLTCISPDPSSRAGGSSRRLLLFSVPVTCRGLAPAAPVSETAVTREQLLATAYSAFNARDTDAALATMAADVAGPEAFKCGFARGHRDVRAYRTG